MELFPRISVSFYVMTAVRGPLERHFSESMAMEMRRLLSSPKSPHSDHRRLSVCLWAVDLRCFWTAMAVYGHVVMLNVVSWVLIGLLIEDTDTIRKLNANGPMKVEWFIARNIRIQSIDCGQIHVMALSVEGNVYCWGDNRYHQCGIENESEEDAEQMIVSPSMVQSLKGQCVTSIKSGLYHCGAVTDEQNYYLWGSNDVHQCCCYTQDISGLSDVVVDIVSPGPSESMSSIWEPFCCNEYVLEESKATEIIDFFLGFDKTLFLLNM